MTAVTILDGSMGQELVNRVGQPDKPLWGIGVMAERPELVRAIHDDYFAAGAEIATTNTYNNHRDRFRREGDEADFAPMLHLACRLAAEARDAHGAGLVAGSIGPLVESYRPLEGTDPEDAAPKFEEVARVIASYADLILLETMSSLGAARGAVMGAAVPGKPVWLSVTVKDDDGSVLRSGEPVTGVLDIARDLPVAALLVNCSRPEAVTQALPILAPGATALGLPFGAYANGFTRITETFLEDPDPQITMLAARRDLAPAAYADFAERWVADGAAIVGGCCEVGPAHIAELVRRLK